MTLYIFSKSSIENILKVFYRKYFGNLSPDWVKGTDTLFAFVCIYLLHSTAVPVCFPIRSTDWLHHIQARGLASADGFTCPKVHQTRVVLATRVAGAGITGAIVNMGQVFLVLATVFF